MSQIKKPLPTSGVARSLSRRCFLKQAGLTAALASPVGWSITRGGESPNNKLNLAFVGVGGRGRANLDGLAAENILALCDVDTERAADSFKEWPNAKRFTDYRRMFDQLDSEIDGVVVSTPDHMHAVVVMEAIERGKHVYCEKPLAHSLYEVRRMTEAARKQGVATQLGNQGHSTDSIRQFCEMVWDGAVGTVQEAQVWCQSSYRPRDYRLRPTETPPVPETLDWNQWLGPAAYRPYSPAYLPGSWRGWVDFGTGCVGDWVCHTVDPVFWALDLGAPISVQAHAEEYDDAAVRAETYPGAAQITWRFPATAKRPAVTLRWFEGRTRVPRPKDLDPGREVPNIGGLAIGDKGSILYGSHGAGGAQLLPSAKNDAYQRPERTIKRSEGHHQDWVLACKGGAPASASWNYGGPLTEVALLGVLALRMNGQLLEWDSKALRVTNNQEANQYVNPPYRDGWKL